MTEAIEFFTNPMSRGRTVRWMLEELNVPYTAEIVPFGPGMKRKEYLAINPMGKVPAIRHKGMVVTEVAAILAYLADAFPEKQLAPSVADASRGSYYRWMFFGAGPLEYAVVNRSFGFEVPEDGKGRVGYGSYEDAVNTLEGWLSGHEYMAGTFSAADVFIASLLGWGMFSGSIEKRGAFQGYVGRMMTRPAAVRARSLDDALVEKPAS